MFFFTFRIYLTHAPTANRPSYPPWPWSRCRSGSTPRRCRSCRSPRSEARTYKGPPKTTPSSPRSPARRARFSYSEATHARALSKFVRTSLSVDETRTQQRRQKNESVEHRVRANQKVAANSLPTSRPSFVAKVVEYVALPCTGAAPLANEKYATYRRARMLFLRRVFSGV